MSKPIAFEDIQVGDKITATSTKPNGAVAVYTDTVTGMRDGGVQTANFYFDIGATYNYVFKLVSRPAPAEPQGIGAVVLVTYDDTDGGTDTFVRAPDNAPTQPWYRVGGIHGSNHYGWDAVAYRNNTITVLSPGVPA